LNESVVFERAGLILRLAKGDSRMKVLKSYLGGAAVVGWQDGSLLLQLDGSLGGGQAAGVIVGQATLKLAAVPAIEGLGEAELNALIAVHEPIFLPVVQSLESYANTLLGSLG